MFSNDALTRIPLMIIALIPALTFHEWAHAFVANALGDDTAKRQGRLTLNPFAHLDFFGTLAIFIIGFGWAKPVPVDSRNYKDKWGEFWVACAGPIMNLLLAILFAIILRFDLPFRLFPEHVDAIVTACQASILLNLALCFFNLIPIGALDGSHILSTLLPVGAGIRFNQWNAQFGSMILMGVIVLEMLFRIPILRVLVGVPVTVVQHFLLS